MKQVTYIITNDAVIFRTTIRGKQYSISLSIEEGMMYVNDNVYQCLYNKIVFDNNIGNCQKKLADKIAADNKFKATYNQSKAAAIVSAAGYTNFDFKGFSYSHGASFYFTLADGREVRVSDHGVTSTRRILSETIFLSF